jgi:2,4-dienoyl-CoA reductase-like NADH-dependent reductase (Old Yellow Enzyme family)
MNILSLLVADVPVQFGQRSRDGLALGPHRRALLLFPPSSRAHALTPWGSCGQGFATRGAGGILMEATAVVPEGRISPEDAGLWTDSQIAPLKRVVDFVHTQTTKVGVQLAHAGRKASSLAPWVRSSANRTHHADTLIAFANEGGWPDNGTPQCRVSSVSWVDVSRVNPVYGPVAVRWSDQYSIPKEMTVAVMQYVIDAFAAAAKRAAVAGCALPLTLW